MSMLVLANPIAGRGRVARELPVLRPLLDRYLPDHELVITEAPGHAESLARQAAQSGYSAVVAVGGDGTVGEVLNGLAGSETAMGMVPVGTGNDLARCTGIPMVAERAIAALAGARVRRIDLGREGERYFGVIVGVGFPADVMRQTNRRRGFLHGPLAIALSTVQVVNRLEPLPVRITLDNEVMETKMTAVFVMNTRTTGGGMMLCPDAQPDDGLLDVCLMRDIGRLDLLRTLPKAYTGHHVGHPYVDIFRAKRVSIASDKPLVKMFDGDLFGDAPLSAEVCPQSLNILVPSVSAQEGIG